MAKSEEFAVIQSGGKQYLVHPGDSVKIEKVSGNVGDAIEFAEVLARRDAEGKLNVGSPYLAGTVVKGTISALVKDRKVVGLKKRKKKASKVKHGHRQKRVEVRIESI